MYARMAATTCAYGCRAPAMVPFHDDGGGRGHHRCSVIHGDGVVVQPPPAPPPPPPPPPPPLPPPIWHRHPGLCTEGLGSESSESSGDLDLGGIVADDDIQDEEEARVDAGQAMHCGRQLPFDGQEETLTPTRTRAFPPPISVIGATGKPWQYLRAQRGGGRLVLREVRIPSRELLHACREDGHLKLHFAFAHPEPEENNNI